MVSRARSASSPLVEWSAAAMVPAPAAAGASAVDAVLARSLQLSSVEVPLGIGRDAAWPLAGMAAYALAVGALQADLGRRGSRPRGVPGFVVQAYNIFIIAVSAGILLPTVYFRLLGVTSLQKAYCPSGGAVVSDGLRLCFWAYHVSKYSEYADTLFLLLKGKDVGRLHYWHHLVVTFTSWTWMRCEIEWVADGIIFNTFVHCFMYYYYFLAGIGKPPWWKKYVTTLQIAQFVTSFVCTAVWAYYHLTVGCSFAGVTLVSVAFNGWLLVMFVLFYSKSYGKGK